MKKATEPVPTKRDVGRPTLYRPEFCAAIVQSAELLGQGATNEAIAAALGVDRATVVRWCGEHEEFAEAVVAAKEIADDRVEASLFRRSIGYEHPAVKIFMPTGAAAPVYADYTERYPPETQAASLWLRNRRPKDWRDRIEHTGADGGPIELTWEAPQAVQAGSTAHPGDGARDVTPKTAAKAPAPPVLEGEALAVEWDAGDPNAARTGVNGAADAKPNPKPKVKR